MVDLIPLQQLHFLSLSHCSFCWDFFSPLNTSVWEFSISSVIICHSFCKPFSLISAWGSQYTAAILCCFQSNIRVSLKKTLLQYIYIYIISLPPAPSTYCALSCDPLLYVMCNANAKNKFPLQFCNYAPLKYPEIPPHANVNVHFFCDVLEFFLKIYMFPLSIFLFAIPICTVSTVMEHIRTQFEFTFSSKAG